MDACGLAISSTFVMAVSVNVSRLYLVAFEMSSKAALTAGVLTTVLSPIVGAIAAWASLLPFPGWIA